MHKYVNPVARCFSFSRIDSPSYCCSNLEHMNKINDFGPIYTETDLSSFPVEPFNTFSNLFFLVVVVYWFLQIKNTNMPERLSKYLKFSLPVLFVGYVGGTVYHATRSHDIWLLLDFLPILILVLITSYFCWRRLKMSFPVVIGCLIGLVGLPRLYVYSFAESAEVNISFSYLILSLAVTLPIFIYEFKTGRKTLGAFLLALGTVMVALGFRVLDSSDFIVSNFPMGTHFLWHSFGALGCHFLISYLRKSEHVKRL